MVAPGRHAPGHRDQGAGRLAADAARARPGRHRGLPGSRLPDLRGRGPPGRLPRRSPATIPISSATCVRRWSGSTPRPTRPARSCRPSPAALGRLGPRARRGARLRRVLRRVRLGGRAGRRCCTRRCAAATTTGLLAVHSLSKRSNLAGYRAGFVAGDPDAGRRSARRSASTPGMIVPRRSRRPCGSCSPTRRTSTSSGGATCPARAAAARSGGGRLPDRALRGRRSTCGPPGTSPDATRSTGSPSAGILVAPGDFYGAAAADYVRVALTATDERIAAAAERLLSAR